MSETLEREEIETLPVDARPMLARRYETTDLELDGRNVFLRCVPFDVGAVVNDPPPMGDGIPYEESFARGAFDGATKAPNRVLLEFEHFYPGLSGVIGHGVEMEEHADALYGRFRVSKAQDGEKALELIAEKVLTAASVYFAPIKSARVRGGMRRLKVKLDRVALCREGAYPGAEVLAVRSEALEPEVIVVEHERIPAFDPELARALSDRGFTIPDRLK